MLGPNDKSTFRAMPTQAQALAFSSGPNTDCKVVFTASWGHITVPPSRWKGPFSILRGCVLMAGF